MIDDVDALPAYILHVNAEAGREGASERADRRDQVARLATINFCPAPSIMTKHQKRQPCTPRTPR